MADDDLPDVDELFALAPEDFTAARDALAKRLRAAKERDAAAAVKALRRPTVVAWALNQLARHHRDVVEALVRSGEVLAEAQRAALAGEGGRLREATQQRGARVRDAAALAVGILGPRAGDAHRQDLVASLTAASSDRAAGEQLLAGQLSEGLSDPGGFTFGFGTEPAAGDGDVVDLDAARADRSTRTRSSGKAARTRGKEETGRGATGKEETGKGARDRAAKAKDAEAERAAAAARRAQVEAARQAATELRAEADQARAAAEAARAEADRAEQRAADLQRELAAAREAADAAVRRADGDQATAAAAERAARAAEATADRAR